MNESAPTVSVIIPTHNRGPLLRRALDPLCVQTYPSARMEILVVADGCTDGTEEMLRAYQAPLALHVIPQSHGGPAAARNQGASHATGTLLLFLDDDVEASPELVAAHVRAHHGNPEAVVLGYLPPVLMHQKGFFKASLRYWWELKFDALRQTGHRYHAFDLLSGNFSVSARLFRRAGGFDPAFRCHEDYEIGVRFIDSGARLTFAADALGFHHELTDTRRSLERKFDEGQADVLMARRHPQVRAVLPLARSMTSRSWRDRLLFRLAFEWPAGAGVITSIGCLGLDLLERGRMRVRWRRLLDDLLGYSYWRGVARELGTRQAVRALLHSEGPVEHGTPMVGAVDEVEIDLRHGVAAAERYLDTVRPVAASIRYGGQSVGRILPHPGAERLRGPHLRPILATFLARPLLKAMALNGAIGQPFDVDRLLEICATTPSYRAHIEPA